MAEIEAVQAKLEDSNIAGIGSDEDRALRKAAAASDKNFSGAGQKEGIQVWRVENKRTENDTPDFGIARWSREEYGTFFSGDSYLVLRTYRVINPQTGRKTDKLAWDVHFWLGKDSSQDEIGVAAYKAVELDDLLDDGPVQHREVQGQESRLFQSYFQEMTYLDGGIESGFRKIAPEVYEPRLLQVRRTKKTVRAFQVEVAASSLNHGDVFILDTGREVYLWVGEESNAFEKLKGGALVHNIISSRVGKAKKAPVDDTFWEILGGSEEDVQDASCHEPMTDDAADPENAILFRVSDVTGEMTFSEVCKGGINSSQLDSEDVFIVDATNELFVWIGNDSSKAERSYCMALADKYLKDNGRPNTVPITRILEGQINSVFESCLHY